MRRFFVQFSRSAKHQFAYWTAQLFEEIRTAQPERKTWRTTHGQPKLFP